MADLLIVESPAKAKTIGKYLGPDYEVKASVGHIIDLPHNRLGVDIEQGFTPEYVTIDGKNKIITELKKAAKGKGIIYLGPDPDREGEAIAWHIASALGEGHVFKRVLLHELTPSAIKTALAQPVELSKTRFESQQTRRILDRLMGYLISPILWDKLKRGLSAGRVQSVALRLIVERERTIFAFVPEEYWSLGANFKVSDLSFEAQLVRFGNQKISLKNEEQTQKILQTVTGTDFTVADLTTKERKRLPLPPFTTSTLQQAAFNRLKFNSSRTMVLAQQLYEGIELPEGQVGLITYMRTDSVRINDQALGEARDYLTQSLSTDYVPDKPNQYKNRKGAQDAHEAIRPTSVNRTPESLEGRLENPQWQLYNLIWRRFLASQMTPAIMNQTTADLANSDYIFRASGSIIKFNGFLEIYDSSQDDDRHILPPLEKDLKLQAESIIPKQHFTQPPARFNEATLVKELEEKGIGRPSTYATIITTLRDKEYVEGQKGVLRPTEMGFAVNDLLVANFPKLMDIDFTAGLEENLDQIEEGQAQQQTILEKLYFPLKQNLETAKTDMLNLKRDGFPIPAECPTCHQSGSMVIRYGRNGFYLSCGCGATCDFVRDDQGLPQPQANPELETEILCEKCNRPMVLKKSRFGTFLACSGYPECRNTKPLNKDGTIDAIVEIPPPLPEDYPLVCEKCKNPLVVKKSRHGSWFISCSNYPKCKNAKPFPTNIKCPKPGCGGDIVEKPSKRGPFFACSNYPKCRYIMPGRPVMEKCPSCDSPYQIQKKARRGEDMPDLICPNPACPTNPAPLETTDIGIQIAEPGTETRNSASKTQKKQPSVSETESSGTKTSKTTKATKTTKTPKTGDQKTTKKTRDSTVPDKETQDIVPDTKTRNSASKTQKKQPSVSKTESSDTKTSKTTKATKTTKTPKTGDQKTTKKSRDSLGKK